MEVLQSMRHIIEQTESATMLYEVTGDILLSRAQAIAHGVSPNDHFAQGLALSLREQWPAMYKDFRHFTQLRHPSPGELCAWAGADGRYIISLFTQDPGSDHGKHPGPASAQHVGHALKQLAKYAAAEKLTSLALPRIATGIGGMEWKDVRPLIEQHLAPLGIPVILYTTYAAGRAAEEPRLAA
jgi:O-acetyl-ADP-ribose deacetylase (regulator of RNase III)